MKELYKFADTKQFPYINTLKLKNLHALWSGCSSLTSFPKLDTSNGEIFKNTWAYCTKLTEFPIIDLSNGRTFESCWSGCKNLEYFPPNMFDNLHDPVHRWAFSYAWYDCNLTPESIENILISINNSKLKSRTKTDNIDLGTNRKFKLSKLAIRTAYLLNRKGWTITINGMHLLCKSMK